MTPNVPPIVVLLVTDKAVPAPLRANDVAVMAPAPIAPKVVVPDTVRLVADTAAKVDAKVTASVPPIVVLLDTANPVPTAVAAKVVAVRAPDVVDPNTVKLPPTVALLVTERAVPVAVAAKVVADKAPVLVVASVLTPVTPKVPPMVALFVTVNPVPVPVAARVVAECAPEFTTPNVLVPVTPKVPATVALVPTLATPLNVSEDPVIAAKLVDPVTVSVPSVNAKAYHRLSYYLSQLVQHRLQSPPGLWQSEHQN